MYPFHLPDLLSRSPLIVSGRFKGKFPDVVKVQGFLADSSTHVIDVKVVKANDMPLEMVNIFGSLCMMVLGIAYRLFAYLLQQISNSECLNED